MDKFGPDQLGLIISFNGRLRIAFPPTGDGDPARVVEVATLPGLCLRSGRCGAYLLSVLCGSACPGGITVLGGCLVQLMGAGKPEPTSGVACPAEVSGASGAKCLCAVLTCMAT